jgi:hypothetical protein
LIENACAAALSQYAQKLIDAVAAGVTRIDCLVSMDGEGTGKRLVVQDLTQEQRHLRAACCE